MGGIYPGQSAARTGCDHLPQISTLHAGSAVLGQGGGAPTWSVAFCWVHWPWAFPSGAGKSEHPPVFCLEPPYMSCSYLRWLLLVLGLEMSRQREAANLGWLLLVPGLGLTEANCCLFERI